MNKVLRLSLLVLGAAGIMVLLGFVGSLRSTTVCEALDVAYAGPGLGLVTELELRETAEVDGKVPVGMLLGTIDTRNIEQAIRALPHVKDAVVYKTIDRKLILEVEERKPMLRLMDKNGMSAWMDEDGHLLPLSSHTSLRLPVVSGAFQLKPEAVNGRWHVTDERLNAGIYASHLYARQLHGNALWTAQLQHTEYTAEGEFIAHPQVGNHSIHFGDASRLGEKFATLEIFYREGMDASRWNKYSTINLKFKDQIVCTKK